MCTEYKESMSGDPNDSSGSPDYNNGGDEDVVAPPPGGGGPGGGGGDSGGVSSGGIVSSYWAKQTDGTLYNVNTPLGKVYVMNDMHTTNVVAESRNICKSCVYRHWNRHNRYRSPLRHSSKHD